MMSVLPHLDPGFAVTRVILGAFLQSALVIFLGTLLARAALGRRASARHALWLLILIWVIFSPVAAAVADRSGRALWLLPLPLPGPSGSLAAIDQTISDADAVDKPTRSAYIPRNEIPTEAEHSADFGKAPYVVENGPKATRALDTFAVQQGNAMVGGLSLLWAAGTLLGLARLAFGWRQFLVLSCAARPLDIERHRATLDHVRAVLSVPALPEIMSSAAARGPVAVGLLRPRVVLPEGLAESISSRSLGDVLVHECAHIMPGCLGRLAAAIGWYALLAAPASTLCQCTADAGSRRNLRQLCPPVRRRLRLCPHAPGVDCSVPAHGRSTPRSWLACQPVDSG